MFLDRVLQSNQFTSRQIRQVNYCRLFLQVHTVSVQLSELILTSPSSVVSPVSSPANQQNMTSGKNVRTPPPHGKFGERLVPVQYKVSKITSTTRLPATSKRLCSPNLAISLRPFVWKSLGPHSRRLLCSQTILEGPERCAIPSRRNPHTLTLSSSSFPTDAVEIRLGITRLHGREITSPPQVLPSIAFDDFLSAQPTWTRRLLHTLNPKFSSPTIHHHLLTSTSRMNSHWAEAYSLLPIATLLDLITTIFHSPLPPITIWCDNLSVVQTINSIST
jgi:hypothetical protein